MIKIELQQIEQVINNNISEILKDVLTRWDSPVKRAFEEKEIQDKMKEVAIKIYNEILEDKDFQDKLKDKMFSAMIDNLLRK